MNIAKISTILGAARKRLRRRSIWNWTAWSLWPAAGMALAIGAMSRFWWPIDAVDPLWVALCASMLVLCGGLLYGALRPILTERQIALLVDRTLGTDEVLVTALHLEEQGVDASDQAALMDLERRIETLPAVNQRLPMGVPDRLGWMLLLVVLSIGLFWVPRTQRVDTSKDDLSETEQVAEDLEEKIEELEEKYEEPLSEPVAEELAELIEQLKNDRISPEDAAEKIRDVQEMLKDLEDELADSKEEMENMEQAAEELAKDDLTQELADALNEGDMEAASKAVEELMENLEGSSESQRQQAGEALEKAGEQLSQSGQESLQEAGEQMQQAGKELQNDGQAGEGGESSRDQLEALQERLQKNKELAEQMKEDQARLQQSQETNGALEAAGQAMGAEGQVAEGAGTESQEGQGQPVAGGPSTCVGTECQSNAGKGHTWEDEGTHNTKDGFQDSSRSSNRNQGAEIEDFEQFYAPVRMEGVEGAVTGVDGTVDESGHMDVLPSRKTQADEVAVRPLLDVPDGYRDAANRAMENERVPPGYRNSVKEYFDSLE
jgi:hypothetical protein